MTRGTQAEFGGIRVDRPMWHRPGGTGTGTTDPTTEGRPRRLPRMRQYADVAPARREVDIDLTVPLPPEPAGGARPDLGALLRSFDASGSPHRVPKSSAEVRRHRQWLNRRFRRVRRRLRRPPMSQEVERPLAVLLVVLAVGLVACTVAATLRAQLSDKAAFMEVSAPLHRDPDVAAHLADQLTSRLVAADAVAPADAPAVEEHLRVRMGGAEFGLAWRAILSSAHDQVFLGWGASDLQVRHTSPELGSELERRSLTAPRSIARTRLAEISRPYVAELRSLDRLLKLSTPGLLAIVAVGAVVLRRTRNRFRAAGLLAGAVLVVALIVAVLLPRLAAIALPYVVDDPQVRTLAWGAVGGLLPQVRLVLLGLVAVAAALALGSRLEEVRVTPFIRSAHRHRRYARRRDRSRSALRSTARPAAAREAARPGLPATAAAGRGGRG